MAYEYTTRRPVARPKARLSGMGYSEERGSCNNPTGGATRCFRASENSIATRMRCNNTSAACTVSNAAGNMWCCPPNEAPGIVLNLPATPTTGTVTSSTTTSTSTDPKSIRTGEFDISTISDTKLTANNLAQRASDVAREVADTEYDAHMPIESDGSSSGRGSEDQPWYERYSTHITIGSTVIGLGTFMVWLAVRKK